MDKRTFDLLFLFFLVVVCFVIHKCTGRCTGEQETKDIEKQQEPPQPDIHDRIQLKLERYQRKLHQQISFVKSLKRKKEAL